MINEYNGRIFIERDRHKIIERKIVSENSLWITCLEKCYEKIRGEKEFSNYCILRIQKYQAKTYKDSKIKYWQYRNGYNIRSITERENINDTILNIDLENIKEGNQFNNKDISHKEISNIDRKIREIKTEKDIKNIQLKASKQRLSVIKNNIKDFENKIEGFENLINDNSSTETDVHDYIEKHEMFRIFGMEYVGFDSKVKFPPSKKEYEFDLMLKRNDDFWDLIELKGPNEKLFDNRTKHRNKPNKKLSEAIGQCLTYLTICDNIGYNEYFKPKAYIIIGKDSTDSKRDKRIFNSYISSIEIMTYTDLLNNGKKLLKYLKGTTKKNK